MRPLLLLVAKLALAAMAGGAVLGAAEVVLRLTAQDPFAARHSLFNEYDPTLGWRPIAGQTRVLETPEYTVVRSYNDQGVRGPHVPFAKPPGVRRIVVLGDSFADGYSVPFEELFSEHLETLLSAGGDAVEVVNLGRAGYSTDQELLLLRRLGRRFEPDVVLLLFHSNDVWYNSQTRYGPWGRGGKPAFVLDGSELRLTNVPVEQVAAEAGAVAETGFRMKAFLAERSHLYRWVRDRVKANAWLYLRIQALGLAGPEDPVLEPLVPFEFRVYAAEPEPRIEAAWELTEALLAALRDDAARRRAELVVFFVPHPLEVVPDVWEAFGRNYAVGEPEWQQAAVERRLAEVLERQGIRFLPSLDAFRAEEAQSGPLYWKLDGHWNAAGHRFAAGLMAGGLSAPAAAP